MKFNVKFLEQVDIKSRLKKYDIEIDGSTSIDEVIFQLKASGNLDRLRKEQNHKLGDLLYFVERVRIVLGPGVVGFRMLKDPVVVVYGRVTWFRPGVVSERLFTKVPGDYYFVYNKVVTDLGFGPAYHGFLVTLEWDLVQHEDSCARLVSMHERPFLKIEKSILGMLYIMQWRLGKHMDILHSQEFLLSVMSDSEKLAHIPSQEQIRRVVHGVYAVGASVTLAEQPDQDKCFKLYPVAQVYKPAVKEPSKMIVWREIARLLRGG